LQSEALRKRLAEKRNRRNANNAETLNLTTTSGFENEPFEGGNSGPFIRL
jgi:hypothetical protein